MENDIRELGEHLITLNFQLCHRLIILTFRIMNVRYNHVFHMREGLLNH